MNRKRVVIMGAAGRDFHNFNVVYRNDPASRSSPSPPPRSRASPTAATRPSWPARCTNRASRSCPRASSSSLIRARSRRRRSCSPTATSATRRSCTLRRGCWPPAPTSRCWAPHRTMLKSRRPVLAVGATRTGAGKSQTTRYLAALLAERGLDAGRGSATRCPTATSSRSASSASRPTPTSTATRPRSRSARSTSRISTPAASSTPASTTRPSCAQAELEADVILWDGGNNDFPFYRPDLYVVVADPLRPGDERRYHPGETNVRMADVVIINKIDSADPAAVDAVRAIIASSTRAPRS